jgi:hypothetical protein
MTGEPIPAETDTTTMTKQQTVSDAMIAISMPPLAGHDLPVRGEDVLVPSPRGAVTAPTAVLAPAPAGPVVLPSSASETITCPECGTVAQVALNRREAMDFCRTCDYPLFWTPSKVLRDPSDSTDESLRRLPGTVGRATIASVPCPFCAEPNALSAETCVRCLRPMHPVEAPPPPQVYVPPPVPEPEPVPESKVAWWVWALLALGAAAVITLVVLIATHTIGN